MSEKENDDLNDKKTKDLRFDGETSGSAGDAPAAPVEGDDEPLDMRVPALSLSGTIVFPFALTPLVLNDPSAIALTEAASASDRFLALFPEIPEDERGALKQAGASEARMERMILNGKRTTRIGVLARIVKLLKFPDNTVRTLVRGISRVEYVKDLSDSGQPALSHVRRLVEKPDDSLETAAMVRNATKQFQEIVSFAPNFPEELKIAILNLTDNVRIVDLITDTLNISYEEKLAILTLPTVQERLHFLTIFLNREVEVLRLGSEIQSQVHSIMSKSQREFFLREQLKQIKKELGEDSRNPDLASIEERLKKVHPPETVRQLIDKEMSRLDMIPQASGEYNIAYTYIDWLLSVPWNVFTEDRVDVAEAARILDADHYGLKDVKERILEFLSVLQLKKTRKSPIICLVGPPGVGKTSLGKSIAASLGRKFVRMSLGGVKDEAEIRGHRRTYIGALPGRIIQGMKRAGSSNPVFMLDEIDKLGNDFHGDPSSALLEALDPQQNSAFNDHYLEVDYDLSSVMFIATANVTDTIPPPLLDRMEVIRLPGYTSLEKQEIARRYLVPRQMIENGLNNAFARFTRGGVDEIIDHYTMEAGVRNLERTIGSVCRKLARRAVEGEGGKAPTSPTVVDAQLVRSMLGPRKFILDESENKPRIGIVTGLAWTSVGGTTLQVEAAMMPDGKGELKLTGSLGGVMKESAQTAFSYVRCAAETLGIDPAVFKTNDFHIHVPDGATPKDGPSAGVTIMTALVSLLTRRPVRPRLAMTGEITLLGKATAIGGVREKTIAALRAGVRDVILPEENRKDLEHVPEEVRDKIRFHFVQEASDVLRIALPERVKERAARKDAEESRDEVYVYEDSVFQEKEKPEGKTAAPPAASATVSVSNGQPDPDESQSEAIRRLLVKIEDMGKRQTKKDLYRYGDFLKSPASARNGLNVVYKPPVLKIDFPLRMIADGAEAKPDAEKPDKPLSVTPGGAGLNRPPSASVESELPDESVLTVRAKLGMPKALDVLISDLRPLDAEPVLPVRRTGKSASAPQSRPVKASASAGKPDKRAVRRKPRAKTAGKSVPSRVETRRGASAPPIRKKKGA